MKFELCVKSSHFCMSEYGFDRERHGKCLAAPCRETQWIIGDRIVSDGLTDGKCEEQALRSSDGNKFHYDKGRTVKRFDNVDDQTPI